MKSELIGFGHYLPEYVLTNAKLEELVDTSDEWIVKRTGIHERRIAVGQATHEIAEKAAQKALQDAGVSAEDIDLIIVSTVTPDCFTPSVSCSVQAQLGAKNAAAFDINAACSGFIYMIDIADSFIRSGKHRTILLIAAEILSRFIDYRDRSTCVLFGDGAASVVLRATEDENTGVQSSFLAADGTRGDLLWLKAMADDPTPFGERYPLTLEERSLKMGGSDVMRFAVSAIPHAIDVVLEQAHLTMADVDWIVPHQANLRIISHVMKRYHFDENKVYINLDRFGNTSSVSVPLCLTEMKEKGLLQKGQLIVIVGFGGGLTYGAALIRI